MVQLLLISKCDFPTGTPDRSRFVVHKSTGDAKSTGASVALFRLPPSSLPLSAPWSLFSLALSSTASPVLGLQGPQKCREGLVLVLRKKTRIPWQIRRICCCKRRAHRAPPVQNPTQKAARARISATITLATKTIESQKE